MSRYQITLTLSGVSHKATAETEAAARAVAHAFELEHPGDPEAYAEVRDMSGSVFGQRIYYRWMGERIGPRDLRHPMEKLFVAQSAPAPA
jgi:hypothetical protein